MPRIKTNEEMARLDEIFALVENELYGTQKDPEISQHQHDIEKCETSIQNSINQPPEQIIGNIRQIIRDDVFKTKREKILGLAYIKLFEEQIPKIKNDHSALRKELEELRNFTKAVNMKLEKAEKTAKEQDNHHYYKIFAESVRNLLENL